MTTTENANEPIDIEVEAISWADMALEQAIDAVTLSDYRGVQSNELIRAHMAASTAAYVALLQLYAPRV